MLSCIWLRCTSLWADIVSWPLFVLAAFVLQISTDGFCLQKWVCERQTGTPTHVCSHTVLLSIFASDARRTGLCSVSAAV